MACNSEKCKTGFNLFASCLGILLGVCAFIAFFCFYGNTEAGVWGLISGILATICFHMHSLYYKGQLDSWHSVETLGGFQLLGLMGLSIGVAGLCWYIFTTFYYNIPMMPVESSSIISAVWAFMTAKWGLLLISYSRMYVGIFERDNPRLITL